MVAAAPHRQNHPQGPAAVLPGVRVPQHSGLSAGSICDGCCSPLCSQQKLE